MKATELYSCQKRGFKVDASNFCDWFEKKRSTLTKRCCNNCRYFKYEDSSSKRTNKGKSSKKKKIKDKKEKD